MGQKSDRTRALEMRHQHGLPLDAIAQRLGTTPTRARELVFGKPRKPLERTAAKRRRQSISPASKPPRAKTRDVPSVTGQEGPCDPAHLWPRSLGGCDAPECVLPLTRQEHRAFDEHRFDLLPHIVQRYPEEIAHAVLHAGGDLIAVLERLTGSKWQPVPNREEPRSDG